MPSQAKRLMAALPPPGPPKRAREGGADAAHAGAWPNPAAQRIQAYHGPGRHAPAAPTHQQPQPQPQHPQQRAAGGRDAHGASKHAKPPKQAKFVRPGVLSRFVTAKSRASSGGIGGATPNAHAIGPHANLARKRVGAEAGRGLSIVIPKGPAGLGDVHGVTETPRALSGIFHESAGAGGHAPRAPRVTQASVAAARAHNAQQPLLNLPEGVLARIMVNFRHAELGKLFLVCTQLRDAAAACVSVHFNYLTPTRDSPRPGVFGAGGDEFAAMQAPVPRSAVPSASARAAALAVAEAGMHPPGAPMRYRRGRRRTGYSRGAAAAKAAAPSRAAAAAAGDAQARKLCFTSAITTPMAALATPAPPPAMRGVEAHPPPALSAAACMATPNPAAAAGGGGEASGGGRAWGASAAGAGSRGGTSERRGIGGGGGGGGGGGAGPSAAGAAGPSTSVHTYVRRRDNLHHRQHLLNAAGKKRPR